MSNKLEKECLSQIDERCLRYIERELETQGYKDIENLSIVTTYLQTSNLVKHSKVLSRWTIIIGVSTVLLFITAAYDFITTFFK